MSQRSSGYERKTNDLYVTPRWVVDVLVRHLPPGLSVWEPCRGTNAICHALMDSGIHLAAATDLVDGEDFLAIRELPGEANAIVTNPPYGISVPFVAHALDLLAERQGVLALLLRCDWHHGSRRQHLTAWHPAFAKVIALTKRIVWFVDAETGKARGAPSFYHSWLIWDFAHQGPPILTFEPQPIGNISVSRETSDQSAQTQASPLVLEG